MRVTLSIVVEDGKVAVNGPIKDKVLCYGLLEQAKDLIREFDPSKKIIPVAAHILGEKAGGGKPF